MTVKIKELVDFFSEADDNLEKEFQQKAILQKYKEGTYLSLEGDKSSHFPIVKSGLVRVFKPGPKGQEITLYRIEPGQSCILTISSLLSKSVFPAVAVVEKDCEVILIPENTLKEWISKYKLWHEYILDYLSKVIFNILDILENISFKKTDSRILEYLIAKVHKDGNTITSTHQKIALDLGTAREVISRKLKILENQNLVKLSRGKIHILDINRLQNQLNLLQ